MIKRFVAKALASSFIRHATILTSGTLLANLITLLMLPLFARMFSAESFGIQSLLIMGSMVLGTLATGFYDWAIPTPKSNKQARELATIALGLAITLAGVTLAVLLWRGPELIALLDVEQLDQWVLLLPLLALSVACYNIGNYWLLRSGAMKALTSIRFALPITNAALALLLGLMGNKDGLVIGFILGVVAAGSFSLLRARQHGLRFDFTHPRTHYQTLASKFREFPLYGSIPSAMMTMAGQIPLLVLTYAYTLGVTGHYAVVRSILFGGVMMIGTATGQIILKHIADYKNKGEAIWPHYRQMFGLVGIAGLLLALAVWIVSPTFFHLYLGEGWSDTATIARMMAWVMPLWLLGIALANAAIALRKLKPIALWQVGYGAAGLCLFLLPAMPFNELLARLMLFEGVAYALYALIVTLTIRRHG